VAGERRRCHAHDANFTLRGPTAPGALVLNVTGAHNVADAAVVAVLAAQLGVSSAAIRSGLANFVGAPDVSSYSVHGAGSTSTRATRTSRVRSRRFSAPLAPPVTTHHRRLPAHRVTRTLALVEDLRRPSTSLDGDRDRHLHRGEANPTGVTGESDRRGDSPTRRRRHDEVLRFDRRRARRTRGRATREATSWSCSGPATWRRSPRGCGHELMSLEELIEVGALGYSSTRPLGRARPIASAARCARW